MYTLPKTNQEREMDLEARAADRDREMAHVADAAPETGRSNLMTRLAQAVKALRSRTRR